MALKFNWQEFLYESSLTPNKHWDRLKQYIRELQKINYPIV
ncbi:MULTISPECIES: hypothetical protein [Nostocales]|uniref:Uncharacterized protein n=2 Tax=Nostocales TaxID=1161 RepID=A0ABW8WIY3_9CYAN|nr:hypothetical protein [Tolypothrix bouteillei]